MGGGGWWKPILVLNFDQAEQKGQCSAVMHFVVEIARGNTMGHNKIELVKAQAGRGKLNILKLERLNEIPDDFNSNNISFI